jgi:K+/H+ antiporter YhaU regulatory subunit KhtT
VTYVYTSDGCTVTLDATEVAMIAGALNIALKYKHEFSDAMGAATINELIEDEVRLGTLNEVFGRIIAESEW